MFDFLIRKHVIKSAQKFIAQLSPTMNVHIPEDIPLPSVGILKGMCVTVTRINALEEKMAALRDDELRAKTQEFRVRYGQAVAKEKEEMSRLQEMIQKAASQPEKEDLTLELEKAKEELRHAKKASLNGLLPEAFAVVREAGKRTIGMRHFDVQLIGGMVLHEGSIAEMTTGEGKTLVATLSAYLNALTGEGVHIVTVNDYLAKRDRAWMGPIYEFLGLTVGVIQHDMDPFSRREAYRCDITYGTNNEFGFDYLRDNMVNDQEEMVQRGHHYAIVDEVDSILIDEARTPLIISGPAEESTDKYYRANEISRQLKGRRITEKDEIEAKYRQEDLSTGFDYLADEKAKSISLSEAGEEKSARMFGIDNLHEMDTIEYRHHILQALRAKEFFTRDVDYVVRDGEVIIVDEFTGRMMPGRRWSDGLHQAVEAREGIKIQRENQTLATITFQNYFRLYEKLAGMTGTAYTEAVEFKQIYNLDCVVIPTNKPLKRVNHPDCIYKTLKEKFHAVVAEIEECHRQGQPVLVGTISIEKSELLSRMLKQKGIPHQVLNAKFHDLEAHIIAQAGRYQAVTIATNMAGRGTDIMLGGNAEYLAHSLAEQTFDASRRKAGLAQVSPELVEPIRPGSGFDPESNRRVEGQKAQDKQNAQEKQELTRKFIEQFRQQVQQEHEKVVALGGLHVLGTERHESRRIDNQLRGRQGRQGDPGSSRFYVSLEDDLMRLFASERIMGLMDKLGMEEGQVLEHPWLTKAIENAQKRVEAHNFEIRKHLLEYDNVMNRQREVIYGLRREILESSDVRNLIVAAIADVVAAAVEQYLFSGAEEITFDVDGFGIYLKKTLHYDLGPHKDQLKDMPKDEVQQMILKDIYAVYDAKEQEIEPQQLRHLERIILLQTIDSKWKDHLYAMDQLKEGIGLRSFAQRDPLIEYKREGFEMFQMMYDSIHQEVVEIMFKIQHAAPARRVRGIFSSLPQQLIHNEISGLSAAGREPLPAQGGAPPGAASAEPPPAPIRKSGPKVGRNDPCPCGSGKKYKKCCGR